MIKKRYVIKTFSKYIQENYTLERSKNRLEQIIKNTMLNKEIHYTEVNVP